jgi:hypothetical protein
MKSNISFAFSRRDVIVFVSVVVMVYLLSLAIRKFQKQVAYDQIGTDPAAQIAFLIRQACNPAGSILGIPAIDGDGTDEEALFALAVQIKDLNAVRDAYRKQFAEELLDRLSAELGQDDLNKWLALISGGGVNPTPVNPNQPRYVQAITAVNVLDYDNSTKVVASFKNGQTIGKYLSERDITNTKGVKTRYVVVEYSYGWFNLLTGKGYVPKLQIKITNYA